MASRDPVRSHVQVVNATSLRAEDLRHCLLAITRVYGVPAELKEYRLVLDPAYDPFRVQYHSTAILNQLLQIPLQREDDRILAIVEVDLYIPVLTFVFGEAQLRGRAAVVSTFRLANQFYGLPPNHPLLVERLVKELLHELGHCYGLIHCRTYDCVMRSSTYVEEIDLKKPELCSGCRSALDGLL